MTLISYRTTHTLAMQPRGITIVHATRPHHPYSLGCSNGGLTTTPPMVFEGKDKDHHLLLVGASFSSA